VRLRLSTHVARAVTVATVAVGAITNAGFHSLHGETVLAARPPTRFARLRISPDCGSVRGVESLLGSHRCGQIAKPTRTTHGPQVEMACYFADWPRWVRRATPSRLPHLRSHRNNSRPLRVDGTSIRRDSRAFAVERPIARFDKNAPASEAHLRAAGPQPERRPVPRHAVYAWISAGRRRPTRPGGKL
jgi:hypothetical protein